MRAREGLPTSLQGVYHGTQIQLSVMMVHTLCLGTVIVHVCLLRTFVWLFFLFLFFSVDLLSRKANLDINDSLQMITFFFFLFYLHSATLRNNNHLWLIYDGLQESRQRATGISLFDTHPRGFLLS